MCIYNFIKKYKNWVIEMSIGLMTSVRPKGSINKNIRIRLEQNYFFYFFLSIKNLFHAVQLKH